LPLEILAARLSWVALDLLLLCQLAEAESLPIDPRARMAIMKATEAGENHLRFERKMLSYAKARLIPLVPLIKRFR
jgi:hypothetical protein